MKILPRLSEGKMKLKLYCLYQPEPFQIDPLLPVAMGKTVKQAGVYVRTCVRARARVCVRGRVCMCVCVRAHVRACVSLRNIIISDQKETFQQVFKMCQSPVDAWHTHTRVKMERT